MKTSVTRNSRHYLLAKTTLSNLRLKTIPNWGVQPLLVLIKFIFPLIWTLGIAFSADEITMHFKGHHAGGKWWCKNQKVVYYRHMIFVRKDTHIKYLCSIILCQNNIYLKGCFHLMLELWNFLILWRENTINARWIIYTTQTPFSRQRTIMRKITDSWC